ncbi:hypothetical protein HK101_011868, partial [Irineochytrium annulatum]
MSGGMFGQFGSMLGTNDKTKRRTPARAQKLIGDLYLMSGRLDAAMATYTTTIELMKQSADYQWHAAALESFYAAMTLQLIARSGIGAPLPRQPSGANVLSDPQQPSAHRDKPGNEILVPLTTTLIISSPQASAHPQLRAFLCDAFERYREIVYLHERATAVSASSPGSPFAPLLGAQACMRIAKLAAGMWVHRFNGTITGGAGIPLFSYEKGGASGASGVGGNPGTGGIGVGVSGGGLGATSGSGAGGFPSANVEKIVLHGGIGVSRVDVASWVTRARWGCHFDLLTVHDQ